MKRLYIAASVALATILLNTQAPAESAVRTAAVPTGKSLSERIAVSGKTVATNMSSIGLCYRGVKKALRAVGVALNGSSAYMAKGQLENNNQFKEVPLDSVKRGDVIVHGRSAAHPHGHIAVYLGNDKEASDHVQKFIRVGRYGAPTVFRPIDSYSSTEAKVATLPKAEAHVIAAAPLKADVAPATYQPPALLVSVKPAAAGQAFVEKTEQERVFDRAVTIAKRTIDEQARLAEAFNHAISVARPLPPANVDGTLAGQVQPSGSI